MNVYQSGGTNTTQIGYTNKNHQLNTGHKNASGTDHRQVVYRMLCLNIHCGHFYGANGTDVFQRKCPACQGGTDGIAF